MMIVQMKSENTMKAVISATEMCRMLKMSRSQFYSHIQRGTFHSPLYLITNKRPYFTASMVEDNLQARQTGISVNGEYVIFYERQTSKPDSPKTKTNDSALLDGLKHLGLSGITTAQIESALAATFPNGTDGQAESTVLRTVYRHLKCSMTG
jgi:predicted DNA-binding transcriptional regulator AlpA